MEETARPVHGDMHDEPELRRRTPAVPVAIPDEMEDEMGEDLSLEEDEETEADFLDKPEDLSGDEDTE